MKILHSEDYVNEKLAIKPVTKNMLSNLKPLHTFRKNMFCTGDVCVTSGNRNYVFISNDDMLKYDYNSIFDFSTIFNIESTNREGFLIRYSEEKEWVFLKMIYLDDELSANDVNIHILEIYRNKVRQPLKDDYFKNPPKTRLIFQRIIEL